MIARVLIIAGSDSGGGAGIQGDIKTVSALGGYAATAITALTAQNTLGVYGIHEIPDAFIRQQIELVLCDIGADVIKTGMLHSKQVINTVSETILHYPHIPLVVDPVMTAKGGSALLQTEAVNSLLNNLLPKATLITPNLPEAEILLQAMGFPLVIKTVEDMKAAGQKLLTIGCQAVLIKGGHLESENVTDILLTRQAHTPCYYTSPRINTVHTHGTGCTLASAIATGIAQKMPLDQAVARATQYVHKAIRTAPGLGKGNGPLNHAITLNRLW